MAHLAELHLHMGHLDQSVSQGRALVQSLRANRSRQPLLQALSCLIAALRARGDTQEAERLQLEETELAHALGQVR
jgi:hypothetical protein